MTRLPRIMVMALVLLGAGCGYQLRGDLAMPPVLHRVQIQYSGADVSVPREIAHSLVLNGSNVVDDPDSASAIIIVLESAYRSDVTAKDSRGYPLEYLVTSDLTYKVTDPNGKILMDTQRLERRRSLSLDSTDPLGSSSVVREQRRLMREDMVRQMMRQLAAMPEPTPAGSAP